MFASFEERLTRRRQSIDNAYRERETQRRQHMREVETLGRRLDSVATSLMGLLDNMSNSSQRYRQYIREIPNIPDIPTIQLPSQIPTSSRALREHMARQRAAHQARKRQRSRARQTPDGRQTPTGANEISANNSDNAQANHGSRLNNGASRSVNFQRQPVPNVNSNYGNRSNQVPTNKNSSNKSSNRGGASSITQPTLIQSSNQGPRLSRNRLVSNVQIGNQGNRQNSRPVSRSLDTQTRINVTNPQNASRWNQFSTRL